MNLGNGWVASIHHEFTRNQDVMKIGRAMGKGCYEYLCVNGTVEVVESGHEIPPEAIWPIPSDAFQSLMDSLWDRGLRPQDRRHEEEAKLLRESLDRERTILDAVLPRALRKPNHE